MPQVGAHLIIAEQVAAYRRKERVFLADDHPAAFNLGAVGPDLALFLFDGFPYRRVYEAATDILYFLKRLRDFTQDFRDLPEVEGHDAFLDYATGGLHSDFSQIANQALASIHSLMQLVLLPGATITVDNPFAGLSIAGSPTQNPLMFPMDSVTVAADLHHVLRSFGHPYTSDESFKSASTPGDYSDWWWVDILHYRRTGRFAAALREMAETDPVLKAYAEGYMTHVGGDVVGHPYVNAVVGGPYRNHVLRHMVLENIMDTWIWDHVKSEDIITAALNDRLELGNDFYKIARHLVDVVDKVYVSPSAQPAIHPGLLPAIAPTEEDWETALTRPCSSTWNSAPIPA